MKDKINFISAITSSNKCPTSSTNYLQEYLILYLNTGFTSRESNLIEINLRT